MKNQMIKKELSFIDKVRKKIILARLREKTVNKVKIPSHLEHDIDIVEKLAQIYQKPKTLNSLIKLVDNNPWVINSLEPEYVDEYCYSRSYGKRPGISFLSTEKQKELLLNDDDYESSITKKYIGQNYVFKESLGLFADDAVIQAYIEDEKNRTNLFKHFKIDNLPIQTQLKISLLNNNYITKMSEDAQIAFANDNPYLVSKLGEKAIFALLQSKPQFEQYLGYEYKKQVITDSEEKIKKLIYNENGWIDKIDIRNLNDIELFKFHPQLLKEIYCGNKWNNENINPVLENMIKNISKYPNQARLIGFLGGFKDRFDYDPHKSEETVEIKKMMHRAIKIVSNDEILKSVSGNELQEYIENPQRDKLLQIIEKTYGKQARKILEDRPNIDIENIPNFYIFSPECIKEFTIGAVHHFLSYYDIKSPMIVSELVRYPEKMEIYKKFDILTKDFFKNTPEGLEEKLNTFLNLYDLIKIIVSQEITEEMKNNLLLYIGDVNSTQIIPACDVKDTETLKNYELTRKEKFEEAIKKSTELMDVKDLFCKEFFGIAYNERHNTIVSERYMNMKNLLNFYNVDAFVNDARTLNSGLFDENELDTLELLSIINKVKDVETLKKIAIELSKSQELVINPIYFKELKEKIPMQYSKELVSELLTPEKVKEQIEKGVEGISYTEEDGFRIITLTGADFLFYIHNMDSYMSECNDLISDYYERWTEYEQGVSTISGILINQEKTKRFISNNIASNVGFFSINPNQILGMGADDINTTHSKRSLEIYFDYKLQYDYPEKLVRKSNEGSSNKGYAEVATARREQNVNAIKPNTFGGKIMPDYVLGGINRRSELKDFARNMKTNIIFEIDDEAYENKEFKEQNETVERKETPFIRKIKEMTVDDGER